MKYLTLLIGCLLCFKSEAGYLGVLDVYSESMQKSISNTIVFPNSYKSGNNEYPVLYLLHGAGGSHTSWVKNIPDLSHLVDKYQMVIVCPDGNSTSWYLDSPIDNSFKYGTYINVELIASIESQLRVKKGESFRGITGFSMGGHGALYSAFTYPQNWDYVASISGGVDLVPFTKNWDLPKRLGDYNNNRQNWENHSVVNIVSETAEDPFEFLIYCGDKDFFLDVNNKLRKILQEKNIDHTYQIFPGSHTWNFCNMVIEKQMQFFDECFSEN